MHVCINVLTKLMYFNSFTYLWSINKRLLYGYSYIVMLPGDTDSIQTPSSISASSTKRGSSASYADLAKHPNRTWVAHYNNDQQYLTFHFPQQFYAVAIERKGEREGYVKSFYMEYYNETAKRFIAYKVRCCNDLGDLCAK